MCTGQNHLRRRDGLTLIAQMIELKPVATATGSDLPTNS
jgi:hypothetical protein